MQRYLALTTTLLTQLHVRPGIFFQPTWRSLGPSHDTKLAPRYKMRPKLGGSRRKIAFTECDIFHDFQQFVCRIEQRDRFMKKRICVCLGLHNIIVQKRAIAVHFRLVESSCMPRSFWMTILLIWCRELIRQVCGSKVSFQLFFRKIPFLGANKWEDLWTKETTLYSKHIYMFLMIWRVKIWIIFYYKINILIYILIYIYNYLKNGM